MTNPSPAVPSFTLKDVRGNIIQNTDWEFGEQAALVSHLQPNDRVLQLGGNIGASCIAAAKFMPSSLNVCVEPSDLIIPTLHENVSGCNGSVRVVHGIIADKCENKTLVGVGGNASKNDWGAQIRPDANGQKIKCFTLPDVSPPGGFTMLFADCEGCLPEFIRNYGNELVNTHPLRTIIYERDADVDYSEVEAFCKTNGYKCIVT